MVQKLRTNVLISLEQVSDLYQTDIYLFVCLFACLLAEPQMRQQVLVELVNFLPHRALVTRKQKKSA